MYQYQLWNAKAVRKDLFMLNALKYMFGERMLAEYISPEEIHECLKRTYAGKDSFMIHIDKWNLENTRDRLESLCSNWGVLADQITEVTEGEYRRRHRAYKFGSNDNFVLFPELFLKKP